MINYLNTKVGYTHILLYLCIMNDIIKLKYEAAITEYVNSNENLTSLAKKHKIAPYTYSKMMKSRGINIRKRVSFDDTIFEVINSEEKAYWLGFLYADGCIRNKKGCYGMELGLAHIDIDHLIKFKNFSKYTREIKFRESTNSNRIILVSKKLVNDLMNLGMNPNKSLTLTFPNKSQVPDNLKKHFIRGYFDGDGCISKTRKNRFGVEFVGTKEFLESIMYEFNLKKSKLSKDKRHLHNTFRLPLAVDDYLTLLNLMYKDATIYLDRKMYRYNELIKNRYDRKLSIE